jgi:hypothetical protein
MPLAKGRDRETITGHHPMHDEDDESWDAADAAIRLARGRKGYAEGGGDVVTTQDANAIRGTPEQTPDISQMGLFSGNTHSLRDLLRKTAEETINDPSVVAGLTGIPGMVHGYRHASHALETGDPWEGVRGLGEMALGASGPMSMVGKGVMMPLTLGTLGSAAYATPTLAAGPETNKSPVEQRFDAINSRVQFLRDQIENARSKLPVQKPIRHPEQYGPRELEQMQKGQREQQDQQLKQIMGPYMLELNGPEGHPEQGLLAQQQDMQRKFDEEKESQRCANWRTVDCSFRTPNTTRTAPLPW